MLVSPDILSIMFYSVFKRLLCEGGHRPPAGGLHGRRVPWHPRHSLNSGRIQSLTQSWGAGPPHTVNSTPLQTLHTGERRERQTYVSRHNTEDLAKELLTCPPFRRVPQMSAFARQKFAFSLQWFVAKLHHDFVKKKRKPSNNFFRCWPRVFAIESQLIT